MSITINGTEYETIQAAVTAAGNNDTILISGGNYTEQVVIDGKTGLTLQAAEGAEVNILAPTDVEQTAASTSGRAVNAVVTVLNSTNVTLVGVNVNGNGNGGTVDGPNANFIGVYYKNATGGLTDVDITGVHENYSPGTTADGFPIQSGNQRGVGLMVDNSNPGPNALLSFFMHGGSISDFQKNATVFSYADLDVSGVTVTGSGAQTINAQNGIQVLNSTGSISGNTIKSIGFADTVNNTAIYSTEIYAAGNTDLEITNNIISGPTNGDGSTVTLARVYGIYVSGSSGGAVTGNQLSHVDIGVGIYGVLANGITVTDNMVTDIDTNDTYWAAVDFGPNSGQTNAFTIDGVDAPSPDGDDWLVGSDGNDTFHGLGGNDHLEGDAGNDFLDGGTGADTMLGGAGDDVYVVDNIGDVVTEAASAGTDTVESSAASYTLSANVENLTLTGSAVAGTGNALNNEFKGNAGNNSFDGQGGTDTVVYTDTATITASGGGWSVSSASGGTDTLSNIEQINDGSAGKILLVGNGGYSTIQAALADAFSGDTIRIAAGNYTGNLVIDVNNLTIVADAGAVLEGTFRADNGLLPTGSVATFLSTAAAYSSASGIGITVEADGVSISGLTVKSYLSGITLADGTDNTSLQGVIIDGTMQGINKEWSGAVSNLSVSGGTIRDSYEGMDFVKLENGGDLNGLIVNGTHFEHLTAKGIYAETLSNASITNIVMNDVGQLGRGPAFGGGGTFGNGIDLNLKFDHEASSDTAEDNAPYSNIVIDGFIFTNVGSPTLGGAAIAVKARDDAPSYGGPSREDASFDGTVKIKNGVINGSPVGIQAGEPGKATPADNVTGPGVDVENVVINATIDVNNFTKSTVTVDMAPTDHTFVAGTGSTATGSIVVNGTTEADTITTGLGNDTLNGGGGNDVLDGGKGADAMTGGAGDDTYKVDNAGDTVVEAADGGTDTVVTASSYVLGANVENLTLTDLGSNTQTFGDMDVGLITNGENGWKNTGPVDDQEVVDLGGERGHVWRISSDPASGDFAGPYTPALSVTAGEPQTTASGEFHSIKFKLKAVNDTPDNSRLEVDFATANGTDRNNFMVIENTGAGIRIAVNEPTLGGSWTNGSFTAFTGNNTLAAGVNPAAWHDIELRLTYVNGQANDVIQVYLDGQFIGQTTTFENYRDALGGTHLANVEANQTSRIIFRGGDGGQPQDGPGVGQNQGFYFDDVTSSVAHHADGTGNELNNVITGNSGNNVLSGLDGNDTIHGLDGNDTIIGGTGTDVLEGGDGDDTFVETIGEGVDSIDGGRGTDTLQINGTGGNDTFTAVVSGGSLTNPGETLTSVEQIRIDLGGGSDTLSYTGTTEGVTVNLATGTATGFTSIAGIENVTGGSGNDSLTGDGGDNVLTGGGGNDTLVGGGGIDTAAYTGTASITASGGGWSVTASGQGTDTLSGIEKVDDGGAGKILLVGNGGYASIQAAIDASADGDTILITDATYTEALSISGKAITLQAAGDNVVVKAPAGTNAITLTGNFEGGSVSILGIEVEGAAALPNQGIGVYVTEDANIGTLTLDGLEVRDAGSYGIYVEGDNESGAAPTGVSVANLVVTDSSFSHNGYNGANGSAHIKLFNFSGNALIEDVTIEGAAPDTAVNLRPDYGIELTGTRNGALASGAVAMGTVTLAGVTVTGWLHKSGVAIFNYADIDGLTVDGVDLSGVVTDRATGWVAVLNIDGILGDVDASAFDITLPSGMIVTELQGDKPVQAVTNQTITGTDADDRLIGKGGNDQLFGGAGNDELYGHDKAGGGYVGDPGNDRLDGGTGADTMAGGLGNDTYVVDNEDDVVTEALNGGTDTVESSIDYVLGANVENLTLTGSAPLSGTGNSLNNTIIGNAGANTLEGSSGDDTLRGGEGNDELLGGADNDSLYGEGGDDNLVGSTGNDRLDGGTGADQMLGGAGDDTYVVDNAGDVISDNSGIDTVESYISYTLGSTLENLTLKGGASDGTGNALENIIIGNALANVIDGQAGADQMKGGDGNDTYKVDHLGDTVEEHANEGTDFVESSVDFVLSANVENLTLLGTGNLSATGNALNNVLTGNSGNNTIDGGEGADTMIGGGGNDTYIVDNIADVVTEDPNKGTDTVLSSVTYTLSANVEKLTLTGGAVIDGTGNELKNTITGNDANNVLDGKAGADTMIGGNGDDTYYVDETLDVVTESSNQGIDTVKASASYKLLTNVENLELTGLLAIDGTGNTSVNKITGNSAANVLDGKAGADTMIGGDGNDTYIVDNTNDVVTESLNQGTEDTVKASVTYTLSDHVENLELTGTGSINGTGNALGNIITGNSGNNRLDGGAGIDRMIGGAGNDTYIVDETGDVVEELDGQGTDTVQSSANYTLSEYVENLTLTGAALNGTGNAQNNTITGNGLDNVLDGKAGVDTMIGGNGHDTYYVDETADVVTESANKGTDTVKASATYTLSANVENLELTGVLAIDGTGNELKNIITGNSAANVLDGKAGGDTMIGGNGNDTYFVDTANDVVTELSEEGTDTVKASATYTLSANVENLELTGILAINGTGNASVNKITGNSAANVLDGKAGADTMIGGDGNDTYLVDNAGDVVVESDHEGTDLVRASSSYVLSDFVEDLTLTGNGKINGTGNAQNNVLTGNKNANVLDGKAGADIMIGGEGNDTYVVDNAGDVVTEEGGLNSGTDTVQSSIDYTLGANLENLTLTGTAVNGTGNDVANVITGNGDDNSLDGADGNDTLFGLAGSDVLTGGGGDDNLWGGADDDFLFGGAGSDHLSGGTGADTMLGGTENDTYEVDNVGDVVQEMSNQGTDTVQASINYTLTSNVENLTLTGSAVTGTGNTLGNTITGNNGNNFIDGKAGNDVLTGGAGNDTFVFSTALNASTNVDVITDFNVTHDTIQLSQSIFSGLSVGVLSESAFYAGTDGAQTADQRIIYNTETGALSYDVDGVGGVGAVQFATLSAALNHEDFFVV
jgi:Ca2+-binding RTX toxin-like protein